MYILHARRAKDYSQQHGLTSEYIRLRFYENKYILIAYSHKIFI